jgi:hypothetical protein
MTLVGRLAAAVACAAAAAVGGCAPGKPAALQPAKETAFKSISKEMMVAARVQSMAAADTYLTVLVQANDELRDHSVRPEVQEWAMEQRVATGMAVFTNATGGNDFGGMLDMMVLSTLKRRALEEHWIPTLLHEEGLPLLAAARRGERDVWDAGAKVLTEAQLAELRATIDEWVRANPQQYYVSHIRFTDFASAMKVSANTPRARSPGSVFGLLYLDPLAGLDPVAREMQQYRALSERVLYLANRLPVVLAWRLELAVYRTANGPQVVKFVDNTSKFADATSSFAGATTRFTDAVVRFPQDLTAERTAAIRQLDAATARQVESAVKQLDAATARQVKSALDQAFAGVTGQREAIVRDLDAQASRAQAVVGDVRRVVERADEAGRSVNAATGQTIGAAEQSARRTLRYAFALAVALVLVTLLSLLCYRFAAGRLAPRSAAAVKSNGGMEAEGVTRTRIGREPTLARRGRAKTDE